MTPARRRLLRLLGFALCLVALAGVAALAWAWQHFQRSLPPLDGERPLAGLTAPGTLSRDALGTAIVEAANATDAARLLGFAHGQDRFFQMDLSRRRGAGELAALLGPAGVRLDRHARPHRFRELAATVLAQEPQERRVWLEAYAAGVNAGLASLAAKPWEYALLRTEPAPWTPADSVLVLYSMAFDLQDSAAVYEQTLTALRDAWGENAAEFLHPRIGPDDAALDDSRAPLPRLPSPRTVNLRPAGETVAPEDGAAPERRSPGSNGLVVGGAHTASGAALLAGDPHLDLRLPNVWYRALLRWDDAAGQPVTLVGATLPGVPGIVIGSNGHLAWTLTNAYADTGDLVQLDLNPVAPEMFYQRGTDSIEFERRTDTIEVKGDDPVTVESLWTVWGPVVGRTVGGKNLAFRWTLHDPAAANFALLELATATTLDEGLAIAHRAGIPPNNLLLAHRSGAAAWTIAGRVPRRRGFDGRYPVTWTYGDRGWDGYLAPAETPVLRMEPDGVLWSGNQRKLGGSAGALLGDGGYEEPLRARQLRDRLQALVRTAQGNVTPTDVLGVQLDTEARWLEPWRELLLQTLDAQALAQHPDRRALREAIATTAPLRAERDAVAYRLVRAWHFHLERLTLDPLFARLREDNPALNPRLLRSESALWQLHQQQPRHFLPPPFSDWASLRLAAADALLAQLAERDLPVAEATWGERNRAALHHPFSDALPFGLGRHLNAPAYPLPGDKNVPRVQQPDFGASLRLVVAPGHEEEGFLHAPGGQSGHPLSPFYLAGHAAWASGEPLPLLPGEPLHRLEFVPPTPATAAAD